MPLPVNPLVTVVMHLFLMLRGTAVKRDGPRHTDTSAACRGRTNRDMSNSPPALADTSALSAQPLQKTLKNALPRYAALRLPAGAAVAAVAAGVVAIAPLLTSLSMASLALRPPSPHAPHPVQARPALAGSRPARAGSRSARVGSGPARPIYTRAGRAASGRGHTPAHPLRPFWRRAGVLPCLFPAAAAAAAAAGWWWGLDKAEVEWGHVLLQGRELENGRAQKKRESRRAR